MSRNMINELEQIIWILFSEKCLCSEKHQIKRNRSENTRTKTPQISSAEQVVINKIQSNEIGLLLIVLQ